MDKVRKPIPERVRKMLATNVKTTWLVCSKCGCEFEVTEGRHVKLLKEEPGTSYQCFDCLWTSTGKPDPGLWDNYPDDSTERGGSEGHLDYKQVEHKEE